MINKRKWRKRAQFLIDKYGKRFRKFKNWYDEHAMQRKLVISGALLLIMISLLVGTRVVPSKSRFNDTPLNSAENFGENSGATIMMTSRKYNEKDQFMVVRFHVTPQADQYIDPQNVKFKVRTLSHEPSTYQVIPLVNNDFVVIVDNLQKGYKAIQLEAINKQGDTTQTYNSSDLDPDSLSSSSSSDELSSSSSNNDQTGAGKNNFKFVINEDKKFVNNKLNKMTQKQYAIQSLNKSISAVQKRIKQQKESLSTYKKQLAADQEAVKQASNDQQYQVDKDDNSATIQQAQSDIETQKGNIKNVKSSIRKSKLQIKLFEKQINDIESGKYKFPAKVSTGEMK